jgi:hypothetical protein
VKRPGVRSRSFGHNSPGPEPKPINDHPKGTPMPQPKMTELTTDTAIKKATVLLHELETNPDLSTAYAERATQKIVAYSAIAGALAWRDLVRGASDARDDDAETVATIMDGAPDGTPEPELDEDDDANEAPLPDPNAPEPSAPIE